MRRCLNVLRYINYSNSYKLAVVYPTGMDTIRLDAGVICLGVLDDFDSSVVTSLNISLQCRNSLVDFNLFSFAASLLSSQTFSNVALCIDAGS